MIVVMHEDAPESAIEGVISWLSAAGYIVQRLNGIERPAAGERSSVGDARRTSLSAVGSVNSDDMNVIREFEGVSKVIRVSEPFRLASRRFRQASNSVSGNWGTIGGSRPWIAIEPVGLPPEDDKAALGEASLLYRLSAGRPFDAAVTRAKVAPESIGALACLSIHATPQSQRYPVIFVTRPSSAGADAWISRADSELRRSENSVVLIEAGGEYPSGARTLEVAAIVRAKLRTHLPIVVDVPLIAQQTRYCAPVASAAIAAGADGVILRVWLGPQDQFPRVPATLNWEQAADLAGRLRAVAEALRSGGHGARPV
jgi:3-deoxy-7-phosphoheptulonate synthase